MISIVMIVHNVGQYVQQSIESVLAQTYKDFELILVVGKGEDDSEKICRKYAEIDDRIKFLLINANGIADARNHGLALATGDYLGFVDSDDYIDPDMFEVMLKNLKESDADVSICGRYYEYENKTLQDSVKPIKVMTGEEAIEMTLRGDGFFLHCWDKLFSRKIYEGLNFRTDVLVEDRIVVDKLLGKADKVVYDSSPKYHFRERYGSCSKASGMIRNNVIANEVMQAFILENHPNIRISCQKFMLNEYITAVQNLLSGDEYSREDFTEYTTKIAKLYKEVGRHCTRNVKIKSVMALCSPGILQLYTKIRKKKTADDLVRFP